MPSDLEQMPNLLRFITGHGTLISHEHTPLIAHTADDIVTSESGLYGSDQGMPIANEYNYYKPDGVTDTAGSFAYWTDPIVDYDTGLAARPVGDHAPTLVGASGQNAPAPWVPYTRAGCSFGTVAGADTELENTLPDVPHVYGANSPDAREAENPSAKGQALATADFMGLAVHCARAAAACARGSRPDVLPAEPGGYHGYHALYGNKFIQPVISPSGPVRSLGGTVIKDSFGQAGFPGYDGMTATNGLAYTLDMQLHGVPVTDTYLSDLHDSSTAGTPFGPGQPGYERQLREYNTAFGQFFSALAAHGITRANTLFVITADEGDHFVGSAPAPAGCDGVKVACQYKRIGEINGNLTALLARKGIHTPFDVEADSAPAIYVHGQPGRAMASVRALERATARLRGTDLVTGKTQPLTRYLADPVELKILHMVTGDPRRTPYLRAVRQRQLLAVERLGELRQDLLHRARGHRCLEPRHGGPADHHHLAGPGRTRRRAPRRGQLGLVRPHQHPAHDDGAAAAARRLHARRPRAGRDLPAVGAARRDAPAPRRADPARPALHPARGPGRVVRAGHADRLDQGAGQPTRPVTGPTSGSRASWPGSAGSATRSRRGCTPCCCGAAFDGRTLNPGRAAALIRAGDRVLAQARALAS